MKKMQEKIVLIGAGSAMFTRGMVADIIKQQWSGELALVDIDQEALAVAEGLARKMISLKGADLKLTATTDRKQVLPGTTVVVCTIGVGGRRAWEKDVYIPRKYGIFQPTGDSVLPGGTSRALRMIPAMVEIAEDVMRLAPDALFFNYGNPLGAVCRGVRKATGANMIGLCHGVFHIAQYLAEALDVEPDKLRYTAAGINHLTWFTDIRTNGQDLMPKLLGIAERQLANFNGNVLGARFAEAGTTEETNVLMTELPVTWQFLKLFKAFPAVLDRHVMEFFPQMFSSEKSYFGKTAGVDCYSFEDVVSYGDKIFSDMMALASSPDALPADFFESISGEHERLTEIVESIRHDKGELFSVNVPNKGQIPNLPIDSIVECPAIADKCGIRPVMLSPLSSAIAGTLASRFMWVEATVEAALEGSRDKFVQALLIDGSVDTVEKAYELADELLAAHSEYLPQFK